MIRQIYNPKQTGQNIAYYRESRGMTKTDLASAIGKTESIVRKYENGQIDIPQVALAKLATVLRVFPNMLIKFDAENV